MAEVEDVFVVGSMPTTTYNPRRGFQLEDQVRTYLKDRGAILSVSGPTKCGKTVLIRTVAGDDSIYLTGADIQSLAAFWGRLADELGVATEESREKGDEATVGREAEVGGKVGVFGLAEFSGGGATSSGEATRRTKTQTRIVSQAHAVRKRLRDRTPVVIVDDFHYIPSDVQLEVVRGVKELVFDRVPFIFVAIPHRAYDVVRVEKEMTGRMTRVKVPAWEYDELKFIAEKGFTELNVNVDPALGHELVLQSFSSPHLMQQFCRELCRHNEVHTTADPAVPLRLPYRPAFFRKQARGASRMAFETLARGPQQRRNRIPRRLKTGMVVDIYGLVLLAIARTGPRTELTVDDVREAIRKISTAEPPPLDQLKRVLAVMSKIARATLESEPVVDFDPKRGKLYISDPFFAYYLRWGAEEWLTRPEAQDALKGASERSGRAT